MVTYLLISASSSAATRIEDWKSNWGSDKFPDMASAAVSMSFLAFAALASSSLLSGYALFTSKPIQFFIVGDCTCETCNWTGVMKFQGARKLEHGRCLKYHPGYTHNTHTRDDLNDSQKEGKQESVSRQVIQLND